MHDPDLILPSPRTLAQLCRAIRIAFIHGQRRSVEIDVLSRWHTGRLLREFALGGKSRADHGNGVIRHVAEQEGIDERTLYQCMQFYDAQPKVSPGSELTWSHHRKLITVSDAKARRALADAATKKGWKTHELAARIAAHNASHRAQDAPEIEAEPAERPAKPVLLTPRRGRPGLHPIVERPPGQLAADLGFRHYHFLDAAETRRFAKGEIVQFAEDRSLRAVDASRAELFTYDATIVRMVDGDTAIVTLEMMPRLGVEFTLRLRGLDCPELSTAGGRAAKRFVDGCAAPGDRVVISTTKVDKYARYLADVFVRRAADAAGNGLTAEPEVFLNNALLENGYAVPFDGIRE